MMSSFTSKASMLLLLIFFVTTFYMGVSNNHKAVRCNEDDRRILLTFKQGIIDPFHMLSTWSTEQDCCVWKGVKCDNITSRVVKLDLSNEDMKYELEGKMNLSLLELEFLNYLDLSWNVFEVISIPSICCDNITLGSNLHYLDLSSNIYRVHIDNLQWLSQLYSLKYLNLSGIDLHKETNWLQLVAMLPSLSELSLSDCNLSNISPSLKYVNFTSLVRLDLSQNHFNSMLPNWLSNLSNGISHLRHLDLSYNLFYGSFPSFLGNFSSLEVLRLSSNSFTGAISESFFSKLSNLTILELSDSIFAFHFSPNWIPHFQLTALSLANTNQGPKFPSWIYTQKSLQDIDMSSSGISFIDKDKFWSLVARVDSLFMSNNSISGDIPNITMNASWLELDHNNFTGRLPHLSPIAEYVDLSHNSFSGQVPLCWKDLNDLLYINLWDNKLSGEVLIDLSNSTQLKVMNLGKNQFSGSIPIKFPQNLIVMILRSNQFEGNIPSQLFNLSYLFHLDLAQNKLTGSMPQCVYNMTEMSKDNFVNESVDVIIDLFTKGQDYEYRIDWDRRTIDISSNNLSGEIPSELFGLIQVQTLNLSHNHLTGRIHKMIGNMKNMESLDLSNNKLSGEIPQSLANISFLGYLNLSYNNFTGQIPIGTQLQSFNASSYIGNPELRGAPLTKCITEEESPRTTMQHEGKEDDDLERDSLYLGMGVGFAVGFWGFCGSLFFIRKWRHTYYAFLNQVANQLYVNFMIIFNNFHKIGESAN